MGYIRKIDNFISVISDYFWSDFFYLDFIKGCRLLLYLEIFF